MKYVYTAVSLRRSKSAMHRIYRIHLNILHVQTDTEWSRSGLVQHEIKAPSSHYAVRKNTRVYSPQCNVISKENNALVWGDNTSFLYNLEVNTHVNYSNLFCHFCLGTIITNHNISQPLPELRIPLRRYGACEFFQYFLDKSHWRTSMISNMLETCINY